MPAGCFAERLGDLVDLTPAERDALGRLEERERPLRRGAILQRENDPVGDLFILKKGMMMSYVLMDDGSRQILELLFRGDLIAVSSLAYRETAETIAALTDCVVCPVERAAIGSLVERHPRLAALILVCDQIERAVLADRLAALGRTSARSRVSALLLELRRGLRGAESGESFALVLTQEEIGDATGLTAVHVNRMLRQLEDEGLIARDAGRVTLINPGELAKVANFVDRYARLDLRWLPEGR